MLVAFTLALLFDPVGPAGARGLHGGEVRPSIFGGEAVEDDDTLLEVVAVRSGAVLCTGTVVHPRVVLTAAHCLRAASDPEDPTRFAVVFGRDALEAPLATVAVTAVGEHPDYVGAECSRNCFDLAYLITEVAVNLPGGYPTPIVDQDEYDALMKQKQPVELVGYGRDESGAVGIKRRVTTSIQRLGRNGLEFEAGGDGLDSCLGDSGGPALITLPGGERRLAGILSRGEECGEGGIYGTPYPLLCPLRDEAGVDLDSGCDDCGCLDLRHRSTSSRGCEVAPGTRSRADGLWLLAGLGLAWAGRRQRRRHRDDPDRRYARGPGPATLST